MEYFLGFCYIRALDHNRNKCESSYSDSKRFSHLIVLFIPSKPALNLPSVYYNRSLMHSISTATISSSTIKRIRDGDSSHEINLELLFILPNSAR